MKHYPAPTVDRQGRPIPEAVRRQIEWLHSMGLFRPFIEDDPSKPAPVGCLCGGPAGHVAHGIWCRL